MLNGVYHVSKLSSICEIDFVFFLSKSNIGHLSIHSSFNCWVTTGTSTKEFRVIQTISEISTSSLLNWPCVGFPVYRISACRRTPIGNTERQNNFNHLVLWVFPFADSPHKKLVSLEHSFPPKRQDRTSAAVGYLSCSYFFHFY